MPRKHLKEDCPFNDEIAVILSDQKRMKEDISDIKKDLKEFIQRADSTYAKKEELHELKAQFKEASQNIWDLLAKWGPSIAIVVFLVLGKVI